MLDSEGIAEFLTLGFTLNEKTMIKNLKIPTLQFESFTVDSDPSTIDDLYESLRRAVERKLEPNTALGLSGGLDSRLIAGIVTQFDKDILCFTLGHSDVEKAIARKVASILGLNHYIINDNFFLKDELMEPLSELLLDVGGTLSLFNALTGVVVTRHLREFGIKKSMGGGLFEIVNGGWNLQNLGSPEAFCRKIVSLSNPVVPQEYRDMTYQHLVNSCDGLSFREVVLEVYGKNNCRLYKSKHTFPYLWTLNDSEVLAAINSLPYRMTIFKRMQKAILKKYFPRLYHLPYALSTLPPCFPMQIHIGIQKIGTWLSHHVSPNNPSPLLTTDSIYWFRNNIERIYKLAANNLPNEISRKQIRRLFRNLTPSNSAFIDKLCTHNILKNECA